MQGARAEGTRTRSALTGATGKSEGGGRRHARELPPSFALGPFGASPRSCAAPKNVGRASFSPAPVRRTHGGHARPSASMPARPKIGRDERRPPVPQDWYAERRPRRRRARRAPTAGMLGLRPRCPRGPSLRGMSVVDLIHPGVGDHRVGRARPSGSASVSMWRTRAPIAPGSSSTPYPPSGCHSIGGHARPTASMPATKIGG